MTFEEALREIGIAPDSGQEEIRRAYLRLVKTRKPETDPEGFRRLREAYEILRHLQEPAPEIRVEPQPVVARPAGPQADPEEDAGLAPEDVDCEDLIDEAETWFSQGETARAVEAVLEALQAAEAQGDLPEPYPVILLILRLQAQGEAAEADQIQERFQSLLRSSGQELSLLDDETAALWQVAQEIPRLSARFPAPARAAISAAVITGDPERAVPQLLEIVETDGDLGRLMAAEIKDLPGLEALYHDVLLEALNRRKPWRRTAKQPWRPGVVGGAVIVIWFLAQLSGSLNRPVPQEPVMRYPLPLPPRPARHAAAPPLPQSLGEALAMACLPGVPSPGQSAFCSAAREAISNLQQRRCHEVRETRGPLLEGLQMMRGSSLAESAEALVAALRAEYFTICQEFDF